MNKISLTASMRSNLLSLQNISRQVSSTQNKLATGNKVNSAIDNPSSYYTARALNNRADDLNALLDSMGQAVSTIKAATTALEAGADFLEQAAAVATQALETAKIPSKSWFEQQEGVAAVVSSWDELKAVLDSGKAGNIVIYGNIEAQDTVTLKAGQNLVGVGYYGVSEPDTDKFSQLSFDLDNLKITAAIELRNNDHLIADLSVKSIMRSDSTSILMRMSNTQNYTLQNMDIYVDTSKMLPYEQSKAMSTVITNGTITMKGINNLYSSYTGKIYAQGFAASKVTLSDNATLNIQMNEMFSRAFMGGDGIFLYDNAKLNINTGMLAFETSSLFLHDNSQANISTGSAAANPSAFYYARDIEINGAAKLNIFGRHAFWLPKETPINFRITSVQAQVNINTTISQVTNPGKMLLSTVKGSQITINNKKYTTESLIDKPITTQAEFLGSLIKNGSTQSLNDLESEKLKNANVIRQTDNYGYNNGLSEDNNQYTKILNQYEQLIKDGSYKGTNLLTNDSLNIKFNETGNASLNVSGKDMSSASLGLNTVDWQTQADITRSLSEISAALKSIRNFSAELGNNYNIITSRQDFTENLINILTEGADKLTLADMNEESANMLALQTRQQLAINSLSLASQASQAVLKLF